MVASFVSDGGTALLHFWRKKGLYQMVIQLRLEAFQLKKNADGFTPDPVLLSAIVSVFMDQSVCSKGDETHGHVLHIYGKIIVKMLNISKAHIF